jgi:uncharacterized protein (DUF1015 family)
MVWIAPFRGIRYNPKKISDLSKVVAPPYDVISAEEQERLYRKSPYNIVRLILNREADSHQSAGSLFREWQEENILLRDEAPALYFVAHRFKLRSGEEKERLGFFALARLEEPSSGNIHPHERTLEGPKADRLKILLSCNANLSSIFALYSEPKQSINHRLMEQVEGVPPLEEAEDSGRGHCRLWAIRDPEVIRRIQAEMREQPLLIADGHHRYEASLNYRNHLRATRGNWNGREAFNYVLMYFANMSDPGLVVLPTHRLVRGWSPMPFQQLEKSLQNFFYIEQYPKTSDGKAWFLRAFKSGRKKQRQVGASFSGDPRYLILRLKNKRAMQRLAKDMIPALRELDVNILHLLILEHVLGLNPEEQLREGVIRYLEDEEEVLKAVEKERQQAAFMLHPPSPEAILDIAMQKEKLPQKSTYFYPKLVSGLVVNKIEPHEEIDHEASS